MTRDEQLKMLSDIANSLVQQDLIRDELKDIRREQLIYRRLMEGLGFGESAEESEDVELEDIPPKEVENE